MIFSPWLLSWSLPAAVNAIKLDPHRQTVLYKKTLPASEVMSEAGAGNGLWSCPRTRGAAVLVKEKGW